MICIRSNDSEEKWTADGTGDAGDLLDKSIFTWAMHIYANMVSLRNVKLRSVTA